jgi:carboxypeptidase Q
MKKLILALAALPSLAAAEPEKGVAYDIVEGLTTEVGQRLAGTEAEARARDWAVLKLKSLGFSNVRIEPYDMPVWERGLETAEVTAPFPQKLVLTALGYSGATPDAGITGPVIGFPSLAAFKAAPESQVKGKIVYVSHQMKAAQDGSGYGPYGQVRRAGPSIAATKGVAAFLIRSVGTDSHRAPHTGVTRWEKGVTPIPTAALSIPDADNLERMLARAKTPVTIHLTLTPKFTGTHQSGNVIADVPGKDPAAGMILIGGHLDSWDLGTGAIDDAAGVAITTAAAQRFLGPAKPRRPIRVVWWGSEEVGGFGSDAYFNAHKQDKVALVGESDFGADRVWRLDVKLPEAAKPMAERLSAAMAAMGITTSKIPAGGGADVEKFVEAGVAVVDLQQDGTRYFDLHHTPDDTFDKIDPAQMQQNVEAWAAMLEVVANAPEPIVNEPAAPKK